MSYPSSSVQMEESRPALSDQNNKNDNNDEQLEIENTILEVVWEKPLGPTFFAVPRNLLLTNKRLKIWHEACSSFFFNQVTEDPRKISRIVMAKSHGIEWTAISLSVVLWIVLFVIKIVVGGDVGNAFHIVTLSSSVPVIRAFVRFLTSLSCPSFQMQFYAAQPAPFTFEGEPSCSKDTSNSFREMRNIENVIRVFQEEQKRGGTVVVAPSASSAVEPTSSKQSSSTSVRAPVSPRTDEKPLLGDENCNTDHDDKSIILLPGEKIILDYPYIRQSRLTITNKRLVVSSGAPLCGFPFFDQSIISEPIENFSQAEYSNLALHEQWVKIGIFSLSLSILFAVALVVVQFDETIGIILGAVLCIFFGVIGLVFLIYRRSGVLFRSNKVIREPVFFRIDIKDVDLVEKAFRKLQ